ncbi:MAG: tRNA (adenosine(37)-N6)-threonylcarbamoyltransferase complex ATPase subunit type 1 TsaE [Bacteroidales bacterium]|nr:tRNA (adenosine(37)-N6)-threonylcarbamoyltransferase complex ATPase subunit type 1 TsaE [Bacteroidales bacterium]
MKLTFNSIEQLPDVAEQLLTTYADERFYAFFGPMGVGKTTLIKALCERLGVEQNVCSPTFAIVNEYADREGEAVYHFDFYRLKSLEEAYDIGYEEYFYSGNYCFTEWTEKIEPLLPDHYLRIEMTEHNGTRTLTAVVTE